MTQYDNDDTGVLFTNKEKEGKQPDYTGRLQISKATLKALAEKANDGEDAIIRLAGWIKTGGQAGKFLSLSAQMPLEKKQSDFEDEIPF